MVWELIPTVNSSTAFHYATLGETRHFWHESPLYKWAGLDYVISVVSSISLICFNFIVEYDKFLLTYMHTKVDIRLFKLSVESIFELRNSYQNKYICNLTEGSFWAPTSAILIKTQWINLYWLNVSNLWFIRM